MLLVLPAEPAETAYSYRRQLSEEKTVAAKMGSSNQF